MIISNKQVQSILSLNQVTEPKKKGAVVNNSKSVSKADSLVLSDRAQGLQFTTEQVLKSPEVRAEKVTELKKQIQDGTYQVPASDIASKMVGRSLVDEIAGR
ncbi:MAG TPA: flagellar biosynthesis anti-sigma factor FlgM [Firmicutes bacterium]|jgi:negative regulator of flagellin synthesis FlgM|nr:flagellar biosynthesis anti-sigma factor FlgM [Bacillota bacterium]